MASAVIYACTTLGCVCVFPGVFLSSRVTGASHVTTDLIMRVNVRTTTTTTTDYRVAIYLLHGIVYAGQTLAVWAWYCLRCRLLLHCAN